MIGLFFALGKPMAALFEDPERFRSWVREMGAGGRLAFVGMVAVQIVVAFIPGEPLEIAAGYAFGAWEGTLLCMLGAGVGGMAVFLLARKLGVRAVEAFVPREKIDSLGFVRDARRLTLWMWILFLIPGTPKDALAYRRGADADAAADVGADRRRGARAVDRDVDGRRRRAGRGARPAVAAAALGAAALAAVPRALLRLAAGLREARRARRILRAGALTSPERERV